VEPIVWYVMAFGMIAAIGVLVLSAGVCCQTRLPPRPGAASLAGGLQWIGLSMLMGVAIGVSAIGGDETLATQIMMVPAALFALGCFIACPAVAFGLFAVTRTLLALIEENRDLAAQLRQARRDGAK